MLSKIKTVKKSNYLQKKKKERLTKAKKKILEDKMKKELNKELLKQEEERLNIRKEAEARDVDKYELLKFYREEYPELSINELKNVIKAETGHSFPLVRDSIKLNNDFNDDEKLNELKQKKQQKEYQKLRQEKQRQKEEQKLNLEQQKKIEEQLLEEELKRFEADLQKEKERQELKKEKILRGQKARAEDLDKRKKEREAEVERLKQEAEEYAKQRKEGIERLSKKAKKDKEKIEQKIEEKETLLQAQQAKWDKKKADNAAAGKADTADGGAKVKERLDKLQAELDSYKKSVDPNLKDLTDKDKQYDDELTDFDNLVNAEIQARFKEPEPVVESADETDDRLKELEEEAKQKELEYNQRVNQLEARENSIKSKYAIPDEDDDEDDDKLLYGSVNQSLFTPSPQKGTYGLTPVPLATFKSSYDIAPTQAGASASTADLLKDAQIKAINNDTSLSQSEKLLRIRDVLNPAPAPAPAPAPVSAPSSPVPTTPVATTPVATPVGSGLKFYKRYMIHPRNIDTKGGKLSFDKTGHKHIELLKKIHHPKVLGQIVGMSVLNKLALNNKNNIKGGGLLDSILSFI